MAELINATDSLNEGREKINNIAREMNVKDVASMPEVVNARNGHSSLKGRLDSDKDELDIRITDTDLKANARIDQFISLEDGSTTGDAQLIDGAVGADGTRYSNIGTNIRRTQEGEALLENSISAEKIKSSDNSVNILNKENLEAGLFMNATLNNKVEARNNAAFRGSPNKIPVKAGDVVRFNKALENVYFVGVDNNDILRQLGGQRSLGTYPNGAEVEVTVEDGVTGFYTSVYGDFVDEAMITINHRMPVEYVGYRLKKTLDWLDYKPKSIRTEHLSDDIELNGGGSETEESFSGKKVVWFGTSIDWQDGKNYSGGGAIARGWPTHFREQLGVTVDNQAISGSCMAKGTRYPNENNTGIEKIRNYSGFQNASYVIINHATNDLVLGSPVGNIQAPTLSSGTANFNENTFFGAYQAAIEHIQNQNPGIRIVLVTPIHRNSGSYNSFNERVGDENVSLMDFREAVLQLGLYYGLYVIDLTKKSGINMNNLNIYTRDGLHLNDNGYAYSSVPFINEFKLLRSLSAV